jgi:hypothetical protein
MKVSFLSIISLYYNKTIYSRCEPSPILEKFLSPGWDGHFISYGRTLFGIVEYFEIA